MNEEEKQQHKQWNWNKKLNNGLITSIEIEICEKQNAPKLILTINTKDFSQTLCVH